MMVVISPRPSGRWPVTAATVTRPERSRPALVMNALAPSITHSSPSSAALVRREPASEPPARSIASARGATTSSAKARTILRNSSCSGVSSRSIGTPWSGGAGLAGCLVGARHYASAPLVAHGVPLGLFTARDEVLAAAFDRLEHPFDAPAPLPYPKSSPIGDR